MNEVKKAYLATAGAVIAVSFSAPLIKVSLGENVPAVIIAFYRLFITTLLLAPAAIGRRKYRDEIMLLTKFDVIVLSLSGLFLAFHFAVWISSLKYATTFESTVLVSVQPIFVIYGSYLLFKEKMNKASLWGGILAIFGTIVISMGDIHYENRSLWGDILALMGAVFMAGYFLCGRNLRKRISLLTYTFIVYGVCAVILFCMVIITQQPLYPYSFKSISIFFALSVFCTLLGHSIFNGAMKYISASTISVMILGEPLGAALWAYLFFHEIPAFDVIFGGFLIIAGVVLYTLMEDKVCKKREEFLNKGAIYEKK